MNLCATAGDAPGGPGSEGENHVFGWECKHFNQNFRAEGRIRPEFRGQFVATAFGDSGEREEQREANYPETGEPWNSETSLSVSPLPHATQVPGGNRPDEPEEVVEFRRAE